MTEPPGPASAGAPAGGPVAWLGPAGSERCPRRLALDLEAGAADDPARVPVDPGVAERAEATARRRREVRDAVLAAVPGAVDAVGDHWIDLPRGLPPGAAALVETEAALAAGAPLVWGAALAGDPASRRAPVRATVVARPGGGYVPVAVVNHKVVDPARTAAPRVALTGLAPWRPVPVAGWRHRRHAGDSEFLAHAWRLLAAAGRVAGEPSGGVLGLGTPDLGAADPGGRGPAAVALGLTDALRGEDVLHRSRLAVADGREPTRPSRLRECRSCPWWERRCRAELEAGRDVSLVVTGEQAPLLRAAGVETVDELAAATAAPARWPGESFARCVARARAWRDGERLVPLGAAPTIRRADVEVDVDVETSVDGRVYLWGMLVSTPEDPAGTYEAFATWEALPSRAEGEAFAGFWARLAEVRATAVAAGRSVCAYCYSATSENTWIVRSARRFGPESPDPVPGAPGVAEARAFLASDEWVDVHAAVRGQFVSTVGTGLKAVAPVAGFAWRDAEASGEASLAWHRELGESAGADARRLVDRLLEYNEDDVRAERAVREWITRWGSADPGRV